MTDMLITRFRTSEQGTFGKLTAAGWSFWCYTVEKPWKDNTPYISCIPEGLYRVEVWDSEKFPVSYILQDVPGRTYILLHPGNTVDDVVGCIAPGMKLGTLGELEAVLESWEAMEKLRELQGTDPFNLMVRWG